MEFNAYFFFIAFVFVLKTLITNRSLSNLSKGILVLFAVVDYGIYLGFSSAKSMPSNLYKVSQELYGPLGVSRSTSVEEARSFYRKLSVKLSPDKNASHDAAQQFIAMQEVYSILSNPTNRAAYEAYGKGAVVDSDAAGFYFVWMMLAYGMTCSTRTEYGGRLILLGFILIGLSEFEVKTTISNDPPYGYFDFTVFEWFELLRAIFPALAALLMAINEWRYYTKEAESDKDLEK